MPRQSPVGSLGSVKETVLKVQRHQEQEFAGRSTREEGEKKEIISEDCRAPFKYSAESEQQKHSEETT